MDLEQYRTKFTGDEAATYNQQRVGTGRWVKEQEIVETLLSGLRAERGEGFKVLDIPVGTGRFLRAYRDLGIRAWGFDASADMLRQARRDATALGYDDVRLEEADIANVPLRNGAVDAVVCIRFLENLDRHDFGLVVAELDRVSSADLILGIRSWSRRALALKRNGDRVRSGLVHPIATMRRVLAKLKAGSRTKPVTKKLDEDVMNVIAGLSLTVKERVFVCDEKGAGYVILHLRKSALRS